MAQKLSVIIGPLSEKVFEEVLYENLDATAIYKGAKKWMEMQDFQ